MSLKAATSPPGLMTRAAGIRARIVSVGLLLGCVPLAVR